MILAVSVEQVLQIVYQPQAVFRIKPVTRCSASIPGECLAGRIIWFYSSDDKTIEMLYEFRVWFL